jgi:hypothetical protein
MGIMGSESLKFLGSQRILLAIRHDKQSGTVKLGRRGRARGVSDLGLLGSP